MTDGVTPSDGHDQRGLAEAGNTGINHFAGGGDLHVAVADKGANSGERV